MGKPGRPRRRGPRLTDRPLNEALGADLYDRLTASARLEHEFPPEEDS